MGLEWTGSNERKGYTMNKQDAELFIFVIIAAVLVAALFAFTVWRDSNGMEKLEKQLSSEQEISN